MIVYNKDYFMFIFVKIMTGADSMDEVDFVFYLFYNYYCDF